MTDTQQVSLWICQWKNFENWSTVAEVMTSYDQNVYHIFPELSLLLNCRRCFRILWCQCISSSKLLQSDSLASNWHPRAETVHKEKACEKPSKSWTILLTHSVSCIFCFRVCDIKLTDYVVMWVAVLSYIRPLVTSSQEMFVHPATIIFLCANVMYAVIYEYLSICNIEKV